MTLSTFVTTIFAIKILFIVLAIGHLYVKRTDPENVERLKTLDFWKERVEFVFVFLMSLLLLYLFNPYSNRVITQETKWLLYLFGIILIVTAQWGVFVKEAPWFTEVRGLLGNLK